MRPTSMNGCATVVSAGEQNSASGMSSTPTIDTSSGIVRPSSANALARPNAISSLATNTAVTSGMRARICPARWPEAGDQSPTISGGASRPASASASRQPWVRLEASSHCCGPATCQTVS